MKRRTSSALALAVLLVAACDQYNPIAPDFDPPVLKAISDGPHSGHPLFFWQPPTVLTAPTPLAPFDGTALEELVVEVCTLGNGACAGPLLASYTATSTPKQNSIQIDLSLGQYFVYWTPLGNQIDFDTFHRVRVLRNGFELGFLDVDIVKDKKEADTVDRSQYTPLIKGQKLEIRFRIEQLPTTVKVNEVESSGGVPGDWIELHNSGANPVNLTRYVVKDNDDTHVHTLPAGSVIPAGGFLLVEESALGFGLGGADAARLFAPDGVTLVDSYSWTAHSVTTYGRCPDGSGAFKINTTVTKGIANDCSVIVRVNEVESNGGSPGDWTELYNAGPAPADLSGYIFKDNDNTHVYTIPNGTVLEAGAYFVVEEAAQGFGLGSADSARLFAPDGTTLVDSYSWTSHAGATYGRCPNGSGPFTANATSTKAAGNDCGSTGLTTIKINEIESSGGVPGDWIELHNTGTTSVDLSAWVLRDNDDTHVYTLAAGTTIAAGAYLVLEEAAFIFGLGQPDAVRLSNASGTLVDTYSWTTHAVATTYGRCPNGTGDFTTTSAVTKGAANACVTEPPIPAWPGGAAVQTADGVNVLGGNMSGLIYEGTGSAATSVLWAAKNGPGTIYRLEWNGSIWTPDTDNGWGAGKPLRYPDGTGNPDAESVTFALGSAAGLYVATERNNTVNTISKNSILRLDPTGPADTALVATNEWNLTNDLPAVGPNLGIEAITWVPDAFLVSKSFFDESKSHTYNPAEYSNHGSGIFFVGVEANGFIYAYALNHSDNTFTRIATFTSGFTGVMALEFDRELNNFWAVCDDGCSGRSAVLEIDTRAGSSTIGKFLAARRFERPTGLVENLNNEGFAMASQAECVANVKPVFWVDDGNTSGNAIRQGTVTCLPFTPLLVAQLAEAGPSMWR